MAAIRSFDICLITTPEVDASALAGLHGIFSAFARLVPDSVTFRARAVAPDSLRSAIGAGVLQNVMGMPLPVEAFLGDVDRTDVLIIPSLYLLEPVWPSDPYPELTRWIRRQHDQGCLVCSACTGAMLLAETGLLDGQRATQHWAFARLFARHFPKVRLEIDKVLLTTGDSGRIVMSGASAAWHDLVLHLVDRHAGAAAAQTIAKFFLLNPHTEGQAPYVSFQAQREHGDRLILSLQQWLAEHGSDAHPVEQAQRLSGLAPRTFNRRFSRATGLSPLHYVQALRIDRAKHLLETTQMPVDEVGWKIGYADPAFFRRLFKRLTSLTPGQYRRKFQPAVIDAPGTRSEPVR